MHKNFLIFNIKAWQGKVFLPILRLKQFFFIPIANLLKGMIQG